MIKENTVIFGDCLSLMPQIPSKSVDMVLCDLPYGITKNSWDNVIPLELLWQEYERVVKDNGVVVFTVNQPFTSCLITSNIKLFKYSRKTILESTRVAFASRASFRSARFEMCKTAKI